jgi:hypothetical protein
VQPCSCGSGTRRPAPGIRSRRTRCPLTAAAPAPRMKKGPDCSRPFRLSHGPLRRTARRGTLCGSPAPAPGTCPARTSSARVIDEGHGRPRTPSSVNDDGDSGIHHESPRSRRNGGWSTESIMRPERRAVAVPGTSAPATPGLVSAACGFRQVVYSPAARLAESRISCASPARHRVGRSRPMVAPAGGIGSRTGHRTPPARLIVAKSVTAFSSSPALRAARRDYVAVAVLLKIEDGGIDGVGWVRRTRTNSCRFGGGSGRWRSPADPDQLGAGIEPQPCGVKTVGGSMRPASSPRPDGSMMESSLALRGHRRTSARCRVTRRAGLEEDEPAPADFAARQLAIADGLHRSWYAQHHWYGSRPHRQRKRHAYPKRVSLIGHRATPTVGGHFRSPHDLARPADTINVTKIGYFVARGWALRQAR